VSAPGITATTVSLGVGYAVNSDAGNKALGANGSGVTSGDQEAEAHALVDDLNAHGGLAGRKVVPVYHRYDATSGQSASQTEQSACADYTQDHHVFAALGGGSESYLQCVQKGGAMLVGSQIALDTEPVFTRNPYYYDVSELTLDRLAGALVNTLVADKYFTAWDSSAGKPGVAATSPVKVGILVPDRANDNYAIDHVMLPALRRASINVAPNDVFRWQFPQSAGDNGKAVTDIQSAVLRFRSDHVTHVIPTELNGLVFMNKTAEQQQYRPRYGISTATAPQAWLDAGLIDPHQMAGATGLGWSPVLDLPASANPDNSRYSSPARRHCVAVLKARNITFTSTNAEGAALLYCDLFYSLQRAMGAVHGPLTRDATMAAVDRLGSSYPSAYLPQVFFGPGHHDPVGSGYTYQFSQACGCMQYGGGPFRVP
jgi:hypothetical protein